MSHLKVIKARKVRDLTFELTTQKIKTQKIKKANELHDKVGRDGVDAFEKILRRSGVADGESNEQTMSVSYENSEKFIKRLEDTTQTKLPTKAETNDFINQLKERTKEKRQARYEKMRRRRKLLVEQEMANRTYELSSTFPDTTSDFVGDKKQNSEYYIEDEEDDSSDDENNPMYTLPEETIEMQKQIEDAAEDKMRIFGEMHRMMASEEDRDGDLKIILESRAARQEIRYEAHAMFCESIVMEAVGNALEAIEISMTGVDKRKKPKWKMDPLSFPEEALYLAKQVLNINNMKTEEEKDFIVELSDVVDLDSWQAFVALSSNVGCWRNGPALKGTGTDDQTSIVELRRQRAFIEDMQSYIQTLIQKRSQEICEKISDVPVSSAKEENPAVSLPATAAESRSMFTTSLRSLPSESASNVEGEGATDASAPTEIDPFKASAPFKSTKLVLVVDDSDGTTSCATMGKKWKEALSWLNPQITSSCTSPKVLLWDIENAVEIGLAFTSLLDGKSPQPSLGDVINVYFSGSVDSFQVTEDCLAAKVPTDPLAIIQNIVDIVGKVTAPAVAGKAEKGKPAEMTFPFNEVTFAILVGQTAWLRCYLKDVILDAPKIPKSVVKTETPQAEVSKEGSADGDTNEEVNEAKSVEPMEEKADEEVKESAEGLNPSQLPTSEASGANEMETKEVEKITDIENDVMILSCNLFSSVCNDISKRRPNHVGVLHAIDWFARGGTVDSVPPTNELLANVLADEAALRGGKGKGKAPAKAPAKGKKGSPAEVEKPMNPSVLSGVIRLKLNVVPNAPNLERKGSVSGSPRGSTADNKEKRGSSASKEMMSARKGSTSSTTSATSKEKGKGGRKPSVAKGAAGSKPSSAEPTSEVDKGIMTTIFKYFATALDAATDSRAVEDIVDWNGFSGDRYRETTKPFSMYVLSEKKLDKRAGRETAEAFGMRPPTGSDADILGALNEKEGETTTLGVPADAPSNEQKDGASTEEDTEVHSASESDPAVYFANEFEFLESFVGMVLDAASDKVDRFDFTPLVVEEGAEFSYDASKIALDTQHNVKKILASRRNYLAPDDKLWVEHTSGSHPLSLDHLIKSFKFSKEVKKVQLESLTLLLMSTYQRFVNVENFRRAWCAELVTSLKLDDPRWRMLSQAATQHLSTPGMQESIDATAFIDDLICSVGDIIDVRHRSWLDIIHKFKLNSIGIIEDMKSGVSLTLGLFVQAYLSKLTKLKDFLESLTDLLVEAGYSEFPWALGSTELKGNRMQFERKRDQLRAAMQQAFSVFDPTSAVKDLWQSLVSIEMPTSGSVGDLKCPVLFEIYSEALGDSRVILLSLLEQFVSVNNYLETTKEEMNGFVVKRYQYEHTLLDSWAKDLKEFDSVEEQIDFLSKYYFGISADPHHDQIPFITSGTAIEINGMALPVGTLCALAESIFTSDSLKETFAVSSMPPEEHGPVEGTLDGTEEGKSIVEVVAQLLVEHLKSVIEEGAILNSLSGWRNSKSIADFVQLVKEDAYFSAFSTANVSEVCRLVRAVLIKVLLGSMPSLPPVSYLIRLGDSVGKGTSVQCRSPKGDRWCMTFPAEIREYVKPLVRKMLKDQHIADGWWMGQLEAEVYDCLATAGFCALDDDAKVVVSDMLATFCMSPESVNVSQFEKLLMLDGDLCESVAKNSICGDRTPENDEEEGEEMRDTLDLSQLPRLLNEGRFKMLKLGAVMDIDSSPALVHKRSTDSFDDVPMGQTSTTIAFRSISANVDGCYIRTDQMKWICKDLSDDMRSKVADKFASLTSRKRLLSVAMTANDQLMSMSLDSTCSSIAPFGEGSNNQEREPKSGMNVEAALKKNELVSLKVEEASEVDVCGIATDLSSYLLVGGWT